MSRTKIFFATLCTIWLCNLAYAQDRGWPLSAVWSPDGETIAVGTSTGVWFFDAGFNELGFVKTLPEAIIGSSMSLHWNASGDLLAVGYPGINPSGPIHVIDVGEQEVNTVIEYEDIYSPVRWHPEINLVMSGDKRENTDIWDALSGEKVFHFEETDEQTAFGWNPTVGVCWLSERTIAAITRFEVYIIDIVSDETLRSFDPGWSLYHAECNSDHKVITHDGNLVNLDTDTVTQAFTGVTDGIGSWEFYVKGAVMSPNSRKIATNEEGCRIRVIDAKNGELLAEMAGGIVYDFANRYTHSVSWHPDGGRFVTVGQLGDVRVWDGQSYELLQRYDGFDMGDELAERSLPIFREDIWNDINLNSMDCLQELAAITSR